MNTATEFIYAKHERRGHIFANQILHMLYDFIPECGRREAWNRLEKWAEQENLEIVPIPDDLDAQQWITLEWAKYSNTIDPTKKEATT